MAKHFSIAATSYNQSATIQHIIAAKLHKMVKDNTPKNVENIVDLGSGTGRETELLANNYLSSKVVGIDIAGQMIKTSCENIAAENIDWYQADIENLPFKKNIFDLAFSNLAIQWCDLKTALEEVYFILKHNGYFIFSILYKDSLNELNTSWNAINEPHRVNAYLSLNNITKIINNSLFNTKQLSAKKHSIYYPDVITLLRSLKRQGVNTLYKTNGNLTSKSSIKNLVTQYEKLRNKNGIPLSYNVATIVLQKL